MRASSFVSTADLASKPRMSARRGVAGYFRRCASSARMRSKALVFASCTAAASSCFSASDAAGVCARTEPHTAISAHSTVNPTRMLPPFYAGILRRVKYNRRLRSPQRSSKATTFPPARTCESNILTTPDLKIGTGLTETEAARRLAEIGYNELPSAQPRGVLRIAIEVVREPMLLLLLAGALTYFLLRDVQEGLILSVFVFVVIGIELYQKNKTERALGALRDLSSPRALVIRDGRQRRIAGRETVPGDIVILAEGDRIPADAVLLEATNLATDESLL